MDKLDLGCGSNPLKGFKGIDLYGNQLNEDIIKMDCLEYLKKCDDSSIKEIYSRHFLEHIDLKEYMLEIFRVLDKKNGRLRIIVPHFSNPYFYSDPTHKNFFGIYTFSYFVNNKIFKRGVPIYSDISIYGSNFEVKDIKLQLVHFPSFLCLITRFWQLLMNKYKKIMEFNERYLLSIFRVYEIRITIKSTKRINISWNI